MTRDDWVVLAAAESKKYTICTDDQLDYVTQAAAVNGCTSVLIAVSERKNKKAVVRYAIKNKLNYRTVWSSGSWVVELSCT